VQKPLERRGSSVKKGAPFGEICGTFEAAALPLPLTWRLLRGESKLLLFWNGF
jgi:hypothetical protein